MFSLPLQPAKQLGPSQNLIRGVRGDVLVASAAINVLSLALPVVILQVYDRVIPNRSTQTLAFLLIGLVVALVLDLVLTIARTYLSGWSSARIQHKLGCDVVGHMFQSDLKVFELTSVGQHLQRLRAIDTLKSVFAGQGLLILVDLPFAFLFFGLIGLIAGPLALVPAAIALALAFAAQSAGLRLEHAMEERNASDNRRYNFIIEVLKTIYTIKALGMESMMARRYERLQSNSAAATCAVSDSSTWARSTGQFFSQLTTISVAAYGTWLVVGGNLTVGGLAACTLLASRASQPMMRALGLFTQLRKGGVALSLVEQAMSLPHESRDGAPGFGEIKGDVRLEHVSFSYTRDSRPIFRDVCLELKSDETIAIMGANGSGKSTLLGLMMGLLIPSSGRVSIDGIDIWERDAASLRAHVIHLPQRPTLFQGTILDNLTMFRGHECLDEAMRIGERLGLHEVIGRMPEGYETRIEHAANDGLPGGVRQRIALVRALTMVKEPRLILFDEANAYLDEKSDGLLLEELRARKGKCAIAIVSHRPSYLSLGDRAYVIRDGALVPGPEGARVTLERLQGMLEQ